MSEPTLGIPGAPGKLTMDQREDAEALIPLIIEDPDAAAYEIIALRALLVAAIGRDTP